MTAAGAFWNNWLKSIKNAANTSVLALSDRLLTLWEGGNIVTEFTRYEDFATNQYLKEVASGKTETKAPGTLWSMTIEPHTAKVIGNQQIAASCNEFPLVSPAKVGQDDRSLRSRYGRNGDRRSR